MEVWRRCGEGRAYTIWSTQCSIRPGFELMTSRSWQYISCHWDAYSNHLVISYLYVWFKYDLGQKYHAPKVQPGWGLNSWPPDHDSTFHVAEMPAITTRPSVTSHKLYRLLTLVWIWKSSFLVPDRVDTVSMFILVIEVWCQYRYKRPPISTHLGFKPMNSGSQQNLSCHWDPLERTTLLHAHPT